MLHVSPLLIVRVATMPFDTLDPWSEAAALTAAEQLLRVLEVQAGKADKLSALLYEAAGAAATPELAAARGAVLRLRRAIHQRKSVDGVALTEAAPMLERELRAHVEEHLAASPEADEARREFARFYCKAVARERVALTEASRAPLFRLGLRLVGGSLLKRAESLARQDPAAWDQRARHTASKLLAYLTRFTTKTSPNGVFCATSVRELSHSPASLRGENQIARLEFLVHVGEARKITACLAASPEVFAGVIPRPNPTLRREADAWTYWRPASARQTEDDETRCQVKDHPVMRMFLEATASAHSSAEKVIQEIGNRVGQDVGPFYSKLVERGILIGEVEIPWNERRPLRALGARCPGAPWAQELKKIEEGIDSLASLPAQEIAPRMDALATRLEALPHARPLSGDDLIRCDAATGIEVQIPRALLSDLERLVPLYARLYGAIYPEALMRESFAARFLKRYPPDKDIPLLDFYHGLFEPVASSRPASFVSPASDRSESKLRAAAGVAFDRAQAFFGRRARDAAAGGVEEVELSEADWLEIAGGAPEPRFSCATLVQVAARSLEDVNAWRARICLNAFFPGAGLSVARLAHLHADAGGLGENPIERQLREGWSRQGGPGAAHAEVTFMHGSRTANAGLRPSVFPLEIELPGDRASEGREVVPLVDLTARWDKAAGRFVVRSVSRGAEILPVISSGINPEGFVSFLTMAGGQGLQPLGLFPGFEIPGIRIWPRLTFGNVVVFRRRWVFDAAEVPAAKTPEEAFVELQRWRCDHRMPVHVFVHTEREPKPFYVNLSSPAFVDLFRRAIVSPVAEPPGRVHVVEMLPGPGDLWIGDSRGRYASEFLVHCDNLTPTDAGDA